MPAPDEAPSRLRRLIGLPLLLGYCALLMLSALVDEVRPSWLDAPQRFLRLVVSQ